MSTTTALGLEKPDLNDTVSKLVQIVGSYADFINKLYPVGSIWMCAQATDPNTIFAGTTWIKVEGRFLLGSSSRFGAQTTGGEENHKLSVAEMPTHSHEVRWANNNDWVGAWKSNASFGQLWDVASTYSQGDSSTRKDWVKVTNSGSGSAHNNMPPYFVVNIWRRTS